MSDYRVSRDAKRRRRVRVIQHYGGRCRCCGETALPFLALDHINGDGNTNRKIAGGTGTTFYLWVEKNGYPEGFQVLCHNCNVGRYINGGICPHEQRREAS